MFEQRSYQKEIMDDFSITDNRIKTALNELETINKYLGGRSTSKKGLEIISRFINGGNKITILDIGSGGSDNFKYLKSSRMIYVASLDVNKGVCRYTAGNGSSACVVCGDAFYLPFKQSSFDVVHVSLFLHHFDETAITNLLRSFFNITRYGIIINDLQRSVFAYAGIKILTTLFSKSEMVKNDGPLSVKRGFLKHELESLFSGIKCSSITIKYRWAFRWLAVIIK